MDTMISLGYTGQLNIQAPDACANWMMEEDLRELRTTTLAFLTDRYDDGTYVATEDDIAELQEAITAFLTGHADDECFCLDPAGEGLLLPGEQFLLPIADVVNRARHTTNMAPSLHDLIDECLDDQLGEEDVLHSPLLDTGIGNAKGAYTPSPQVCSLPQILGPSEDSFSSLDGPYGMLSDLLDLIDLLLSKYAGTDGDDLGCGGDTVSKSTGLAFDDNDLQSCFQASNAASYFDPVADATIPYTSLDQLLEKDEYVGVAYGPDVSVDCCAGWAEDETNEQVDETMRFSNEDPVYL